VPVTALLADSPGENTLRKAADIAKWQVDLPDSLSLAEATIALVADNLWGTRIGAGFYQGARGEQALMTLVEPCDPTASLWKRVWLNVLPRERWIAYYGEARNPFAFPWQQRLPQRPVTPADAHTLAILWQMPRRWRLVVDTDGRVRQVHRQNHGRRYDGWDHPLTPYFVKSDGSWVAAKVTPHMGYRAWAAIALQARPKARPARVVEEFIQNVWQGEPLRLRCCGWALGEAGEAGAWVDYPVPFYLTADANAVGRAIDDAESARRLLWSALHGASERLGPFADDLYPATEREFFERVSSNAWDDWPEVLRRSSQGVYWSVVERHRLDPIDVYRSAARLSRRSPVPVA
jgi:CRISPR system Cascade subunit CasA